MMKHATILTLLWCAGAAASASGQSNTLEFVVSNAVSPEQPSATIELWARFDPATYAFAKGQFDVLASPDQGGFGDPVMELHGPGGHAGDIPPDGDSVNNVYAWQLHWWNGGPFADTSNPILIWSAAWSTSKFTPRTVDLSTLTTEFILYVDDTGEEESFLDEFVEGSGTIQVVPTPATAPIMLIGVLVCLRRSR